MHYPKHRDQPSLNDSKTYRLIPASQLRSVPWKNGGGSTKEILVSPEGAQIDDFLWRVSIADVETEGPFSVFPDIQRNITLLRGESMVLNNSTTGLSHPLSLLRPYNFDGEHQIAATLADGPTQDFNVMVRRSASLQAKVELIRKDTRFSVGNNETLLYCPEGPCVLNDSNEGILHLHSGDSLYVAKKHGGDVPIAPNEITLTEGQLLCVTITASSTLSFQDHKEPNDDDAKRMD